jgi:hypothetical protein
VLDADTVFFCCFFLNHHQADSLEEAINIINKNKYLFKTRLLSSSPFIKLQYIFISNYSNISNRYGNGASIFTTSGVSARKFQTEIEAGQVIFTTFWNNINKEYSLRSK